MKEIYCRMLIVTGDTEIEMFEGTFIGDDQYFVYEDEYGRRWKLEPLKNINIQMPFRIVPLPMEKKDDL